MSNFSSDFWGFAGATNNPSVTTNDIQIQNSDPGIIFSGQEVNNPMVVDVREVSGQFWIAFNAVFNKTTLQYNQVNVAIPSYGFVFNSNIGAGGTMGAYFAAAVGSGTLPQITFGPVPLSILTGLSLAGASVFTGNMSIVGNLAITGNETITGNLTIGGNFSLPYSFQRNKFINGGMQIDQRNNGTVVSGTNVYTVDRWLYSGTQTTKLTAQQNPAAGVGQNFSNFLRFTSTGAYTVLAADNFTVSQSVEASNVQELMFGSSTPVPLSVSFYARSSIAGTFSVALTGGAGRVYVTTIALTTSFARYTINLPGDAAGTWVKSGTGIGISIVFSLGSGSNFQTSTLNAWQTSTAIAATGSTSILGVNGATFDLSQVQLETGSIATPFEERLYTTELALCQRYCYVINSLANVSAYFGTGWAGSTSLADIVIPFPVPMRVNPTFIASGAAANYAVNDAGTAQAGTSLPTMFNSSQWAALIQQATAAVLGSGHGVGFLANTSAAAQLAFSADY